MILVIMYGVNYNKYERIKELLDIKFYHAGVKNVEYTFISEKVTNEDGKNSIVIEVKYSDPNDKEKIIKGIKDFRDLNDTRFCFMMNLIDDYIDLT